jgi:hypothetical protein
MNDKLIQALTAYTNELEQQLAALESRVEQLEKQLKELTGTIATIGDKQETKIDKLEEPEVEVELIMDDELEEELTEVEASDEELNEEVEEEKAVEQVIEEPKVVAQKNKKKAVAKPEPAAGMPMQGSLFGTTVEDIRQAISLGDRFLFQRELFEGNGELMQQALDELNELYSLNEAMTYINEHYEWDKDSTAFQLFENVLKRRFAN